jgi:riboflavin kinase/FMN adenylyltransferase
MGKRVIALGFFDGVHLGHATLIERAKLRAGELNAAPALLTFDIHPDTIVKGIPVPLLSSRRIGPK